MAKRAGRINGVIAKEIGDWSGVIQFFDRAGIEVKKKTIEAQWEVCKKLKAIVVGHILAQDLNWPQLSSKTVKNKSQNKNMVYIDTETYLNNITTWKRLGTSYVGIKKGTIHKRKAGNVNLERIAIWMEYGTRNMPARPLWGPSIDELGGKAGIRDFIAAAIYRRLKWLARGKPLNITQKGITKMIR